MGCPWRRLPWPCLSTLAGIALTLLGALQAIPAIARTLVLRADGNGDVPTFQGGIDAFLTSPADEDADTLRVEAGYYDEALVVEPRSSYDLTVLCPSGPGATALRSLLGFTRPDSYSSPMPHRLTISGLAVREQFKLGQYGSGLTLSGCRFLGDFEIPRMAPHSAIADCEFRKNSYICGADVIVSRCRFVGETAHFVLFTDWLITVEGCTFEGGTDTAAVAISNSNDGVVFARCAFRDVGIGIYATAFLSSSWATWSDGVYIGGCRFENVSGAAVDCNLPTEPATTLQREGLYIHGSRFVNCGAALVGRAGPRLHLGMWADTILNCGGTALEANVGPLTMKGIVVRNSGGSGAVLDLTAGYGETPIQGCIFEDNKGDGLALVVSQTEEPGTLVIHENTCVLNADAGMRLTRKPADPLAEVLIENNVVAGNTGGGIVAETSYIGHIEHNDAWMNARTSYAGLPPGETNLEVDPQFCDPLAGDFHVASSSPCAPTGPFGQIGALGVGCDASTVPIDIRPGSPVNNVSRGSEGALPVAILSHRLFDARQVDPATVSLAGAPADRHSVLRDVNGDGLGDFVTQVNAAGLALTDGDLTLEARTVYGAPLRGTDHVRVVGGHASRLESDPEAGAENLSLSIRSSSPARAGGALRLTLTLPSAEPVEVVLVDVAGRRVGGRSLETPQRGVSVLDVIPPNALRAGIYWVRVRQAGNEARSKVCLLP